jgi:hypothetical protein
VLERVAMRDMGLAACREDPLSDHCSIAAAPENRNEMSIICHILPSFLKNLSISTNNVIGPYLGCLINSGGRVNRAGMKIPELVLGPES